MAFPKMRTLPEAAKELLYWDPNTCLTLPVLRRMVNNNVIPHVKSGRRILINIDSLEFYLSNSKTIEKDLNPSKIRKIV